MLSDIPHSEDSSASLSMPSSPESRSAEDRSSISFSRLVSKVLSSSSFRPKSKALNNTTPKDDKNFLLEVFCLEPKDISPDFEGKRLEDR